MQWTDERIAEGLRAMDPAASGADARPTAAEWARLERAMDGSRPRRSRTAIRVAWITPLAAMALATAVVVAAQVAAPAPAVAVTPPLLETAPLAASLDEVVDESLAALETAGTAGERGGWHVTWHYDPEIADERVIAPFWARWVWDDDGTGHLETVPGDAYSIEDGEVVEKEFPLPPAAKGMTAEEWDEASYEGWFYESPPSDADALAAYLRERAYLPEEADGLQVWGAVDALLDEWMLSGEQSAAALELLMRTGDVELLGSVTDRLGREGVALSVTAEQRPAFDVTVVLDEDTRQFIAADVVYRGGSDTLDLPADTVIEYTAWGASPED